MPTTENIGTNVGTTSIPPTILKDRVEHRLTHEIEPRISTTMRVVVSVKKLDAHPNGDHQVH